MRQSSRKRALIREVNDRIGELNAGFAAFDGGLYEIYCECADRECMERLAVPAAAYEQARARARRFVVLPEHVDADGEGIVEDGRHYAVISVVRRRGRTQPGPAVLGLLSETA